jgi:hypothetical protein
VGTVIVSKGKLWNYTISMKVILTIIVGNTLSNISIVIPNYQQCESDKQSATISLVRIKNNGVSRHNVAQSVSGFPKN